MLPGAIAKPWCAPGIEALQHFHVFDHRQYIAHRLPPSESAFVEDAAIVGGQRDDAGNESRFDRFPEDVIDSHCWSNRHSASARLSHSNDAREKV